MKFNLTNLGTTGNLELGTKIVRYPSQLQSILGNQDLPFASEYGYNVYIDQNTLIVSDPGDSEYGADAGAIYVYQRAGADWRLEERVVSPDLIPGSRFGTSVSLDGRSLFVGAPGTNGIGSVFSFIKNAGQWFEITQFTPADVVAGDLFGQTVSVSDNFAAISAHNQAGTGSVYIYKYVDNIWFFIQKLVGSEPGQQFGKSLQIKGNTLVVGSPGYDGTGAVYIYENQNNDWNEVDVIIPASLSAGAGFGSAVALDQGTLAASTTEASVYVYKKTEIDWVRQAIINDDELFGHSLSLSGDLLGIGKPSLTGFGKVYIFDRQGSNWLQVSEIVSPNSADEDQFGHSVSIYNSLYAIGAPGEGADGNAYMYFPVVPEEPAPPPLPNLSPVMLAAVPSTGYYPGGQTITIQGNNLQSVLSVTFNGVPATNVYSLSNKAVSMVTPAGALGPALIELTTPYGTDSKDFIFTYIVPPPVITGVTPATGTVNGGTTVTIDGEFLADTFFVSFDGRPANNLTVVSDNQVTVESPVGSDGYADIEIRTSHGTYIKRNAFLYFIPAPTITGLSPTTGTIDGGTLINITGLNLARTQSVTVGGLPATGIFVASDNLVTALTPEEFSAKTVPVVLTTTSGTSNSNFNFTYYVPAPVVNSITPDRGTIDGSTSVSISGNYFVNLTDVRIGTTPLVDPVLVNKRQITGTTPPGPEGTADVSVTTDYGISAPNSLFTYFVPPPDVFGISPTTGTVEGGTLITLTGNNLTTAQSVTVDGALATSLTVVDDEHITFVTPAGSAGPASVVVTTNYGSNPENELFEYFIPEPELTSITPNTGTYQGGTSVTISGNYFNNATSVTFDGVAATDLVVVNDETITVTTPPNSVGTASVVVTTPYGSNPPNTLYTYDAPAPVVLSITPNAGSSYGGTSVSIEGEHFVSVIGVKIGGAWATSVSVVNYQTITAISPNGTAGLTDVEVVTSFGTGIGEDLFEYFVPAPLVSGISPATGTVDGGTSVSISGDYFLGATAVTIGGSPASSFTVIDRDTITAVTPAGTEGFASVEVTTSGGTSAPNSLYDYVIPAPLLNSVTPNTGLTTGGTSVTISGNYFTGASSVTFDGAPAAFTVVNDETITATTPVGLNGPASVIITSSKGSNAPNTAFSYYPPVPVVNSITPNSGTVDGGTSVTISGQYFTDASAASIGGTLLSSRVVVNDNTITGVTGIKTGGSYLVTVTTPGGTNTTGPNYTYVVPAPEVYTVTPNTGFFNSATNVIITGKYFTNVTNVQIGDVGTTYTVNSSTQISATTNGNSTTGTASVNVTTATGTNAPNTLFTFALPVPNPTAVVPGNDWPGGGASVTITGTNFYSISSITFDGVPVASFTVNSPTSITTTVPAGSVGPASVVLTNTAGSNPANSLFTYLNPYPETYTLSQSLIGPAPGSNDFFGRGVSIYGDTMAIGRQGSSYVEIFRKVGTTWVQEAVITPTDREGDESFGISVSLYENTLAVGAYREDTAPYSKNGAVYIFNRSGTTWTQTQKLTRLANDNWFGLKVSLYDNYLAVAAQNLTTDVGSVSMFANESGTWTFKSVVSGGDKFGDSISLYGNRLAVGDWGYDSPTTNVGRVTVYTFNGTSLTLQQTILSPTTTANTSFGVSVSIDSNQLAIGTAEDSLQGSVYVYEWNGSTWTQKQRIKASDAENSDQFGYNIVLVGDRMLVQAAGHDSPNVANGAVYLFGKSAQTTVWQELQIITPPAPEDLMGFGQGIAVYGTDLAISAPSYGPTNGGAVYTYTSS